MMFFLLKVYYSTGIIKIVYTLYLVRALCTKNCPQHDICHVKFVLNISLPLPYWCLFSVRPPTNLLVPVRCKVYSTYIFVSVVLLCVLVTTCKHCNICIHTLALLYIIALGRYVMRFIISAVL